MAKCTADIPAAWRTRSGHARGRRCRHDASAGISWPACDAPRHCRGAAEQCPADLVLPGLDAVEQHDPVPASARLDVVAGTTGCDLPGPGRFRLVAVEPIEPGLRTPDKEISYEAPWNRIVDRVDCLDLADRLPGRHLECRRRQ